jgi:hypothetical protein
VLGLLALVATALLAPPASVSATAPDTAATHALLQARYRLDRAILQSAAPARASTDRLVASLARECHDVLAHEPQQEGLLGPPQPATTPRARGERQRAELQRQTIDEELGAVLAAARYQPVRGAIQEYLAATAPLSWSDPRIAPLVHAEAVTLEELAIAAPPDACADMKAWAQSGYRLLSPASRAFQAARTALKERIGPEGSLSALLKPSEGPGELALVRQTTALRAKQRGGALRTLRRDADVYSQLRRALGEPAEPFERPRLQPTLGHGKTQSGATFTVRQGAGGESFGSSCQHAVTLELADQRKTSNGVSFGTSGSSLCLSKRREYRPSSSCGGGEASIAVVLPGTVRSVRLRLSDRRTLTSAVVPIPRKDGGPLGVYVQALRGYTPYPVTLTALDREGKVVHVVRVTSARCMKQSGPANPTLVHLASGSTPGGEPFSIEGVLVEFGHAEHDFSLNAMVGAEGSNEASSSEQLGARSEAPKAFAWSQEIGCAPHPFALVFGILAAPGDSVLARTPEGLIALTKQELAANLYAGGSLVYGVFSSLPSELVVRRSDGSTLYAESLAAKGAENAEFCEGLAEA